MAPCPRANVITFTRDFHSRLWKLFSKDQNTNSFYIDENQGKIWLSECNNTFEIQLKISTLDDVYDYISVLLKMTLDAA